MAKGSDRDICAGFWVGKKIVSLKNTKSETPTAPYLQTMLSTPVTATNLQN